MDLTRGNEGKKIFLFTIPIFLSGIIQQFFNVVDSIIVGHTVGVNGLAAVGVSFPIMTLQVAILIGLGAGTEILVAQSVGEKNYEKLQKIVDTSLTSILMLTVVSSIIGYILTPKIFDILGTPTEILFQASAYLKIIFVGMVCVAGYNTLNGIIRATGNPWISLVFLAISAGTNIILDFIFVVYLGLGIEGAAKATVIAQGLSFLFCIIYINNSKIGIYYNIFKLKFRSEILKKATKLSIPSAINQGAISFAMLLMQGIVNKFGAKVVAAYTIGMRLDSFACLLIVNLGVAMTTFTGQNFGANEFHRIINGKKFALKLAYSISCILILIAFFMGNKLSMLFTSDGDVIKVSTEYIRILSIGYFGAAYFTVANGIMRGMGNTIVPMVIMISGHYVIRIPMALILSGMIGIKGVWVSITIGWIGAAIMTFFYCKTNHYERMLEENNI